MTKFFTVTTIKFLIKILRKIKNVINNATLTFPFLKYLKDNKYFLFLLKTFAFYKYIRIAYSILGAASILFNLFLVIIFLEYKDLDLGFPFLFGMISSILSIFPDFFIDFINNNFGKLKESVIKVYSKLKDLLAKLVDSVFENKETELPDNGKKSIPSKGKGGVATEGPSGWKVNPKGEEGAVDSLRETYIKNRFGFAPLRARRK